ncbi:MAG: PilZ domain-containing protein [Planctomycetota bacterium]|jgi:DNA-binding response OmpR family regulator
MASVNVLIADHNNACAFFLKSIVSGGGYGVSISFTADETLAKLSTGLFDAVLCDLDTEGEASRNLLKEINQLLPGLPVIVMYGRGVQRLPGTDVFCELDKPLRVKEVKEVLGRVRKMVTSWGNRRIHARRDVNLPAELSAGGCTIFCRATNLSRGGMQVETLNRARVRRGLVALFRTRQSGPVRARLFLGGQRVWEFETNLAYVERFRSQKAEQVGLAFTDMKDSQRCELEEFLAHAS